MTIQKYMKGFLFKQGQRGDTPEAKRKKPTTNVMGLVLKILVTNATRFVRAPLFGTFFFYHIFFEGFLAAIGINRNS